MKYICKYKNKYKTHIKQQLKLEIGTADLIIPAVRFLAIQLGHLCIQQLVDAENDEKNGKNDKENGKKGWKQ